MKRRIVLGDRALAIIKGVIFFAALAGYAVWMGNTYAAACGLPPMF